MNPNDMTTDNKCPTCTEEQKCWECAPDVSVPDTPRTDELLYGRPESNIGLSPQQAAFKIVDFARQLERELTEAKAEVERLRKELDAWDYGTRAKRDQEARKKAEAEVARLREELAEEREESGTYYARHRVACQENDLLLERATEAEANLRRAVEIAEEWASCLKSEGIFFKGDAQYKVELDAIKVALPSANN